MVSSQCTRIDLNCNQFGHLGLISIDHRITTSWQILGGFDSSGVATAILDRLLHHSHIITIRGESYRLKEKRRSGLLSKPASATKSKPTKA